MDNALYLHGLISKSEFVTVLPETYTRPTDWLTLPTVSTGDKKFVGLIAIFNDESNFVAIKATGAYTVDWGDGTVENIASNTQANHQYNYNDVDLDPTVCSRGYKMAIVTVVPQSGQTFSVININVKHTQATLQKYESRWLDIAISGSALNTITLGASTPNNFNNMLEKIKIVDHVMTNFSYLCATFRSLKSIDINCTGVTNFTGMFANCDTLDTIPMLDTSSGTNFSAMFSQCLSLTRVAQFDTSSGTTFTSMFSGCVTLREIPLFNTSNGTLFDSMFSSCKSLISIPIIDTSKGTTFYSMFSDCIALQEIPLIDTSSSTNCRAMFSQCNVLQKVPLLNTSNCLLFNNMFFACYCLTEVPAFDTSKGTNFSNMFYGCYRLTEFPLLDLSKGTDLSSMVAYTNIKTIPSFNTSSGTDFTAMFQLCKNLISVPTIDTSKSTQFVNMFSGCESLRIVGALDTTAATNLSTMFASCSSLSNVDVINTTRAISYTGCSLSQQKIVDIFNNLGTCYIAKLNKSYTSTGSGPYTITVNSVDHGYTTGNTIVMFNGTSSYANGTYSITKIDNDNFSYSVSGGNPGSGTVSHRTNSAVNVVVTNNWGTASLTDPEKAICTNKGFTLVL